MIKLTKFNPQAVYKDCKEMPVWIRPEVIVAIETCDFGKKEEGSVVLLIGGGSYNVKESPKTVLDMIRSSEVQAAASKRQMKKLMDAAADS